MKREYARRLLDLKLVTNEKEIVGSGGEVDTKTQVVS